MWGGGVGGGGGGGVLVMPRSRSPLNLGHDPYGSRMGHSAVGCNLTEISECFSQYLRYQSINLFQSIMERFNGEVGRPRRVYQFLLSVTIVQTQAAEWKTTTVLWPWWRHQMETCPRNWPFVRGIHQSRWIPHTKASDAELWCFFDLRLNKRLSK